MSNINYLLEDRMIQFCHLGSEKSLITSFMYPDDFSDQTDVLSSPPSVFISLAVVASGLATEDHYERE